MAKGTLKNTRLFAGGLDLTSRSNKVDLQPEVEEKDVTNFGSVDANGNVWAEVIGGLGKSKAQASGQWEAGDPTKVDDSLWAQQGGVGALTVFPVTAGLGGGVGTLAYLTKALQGSYKLLGQVGDVAPWEAAWTGSWPVVRGLGLHPPGTARTTTGSGTSVQAGAVPAGQYVYANLHVLSVSGTSTPTLTVKIQSDDATGFPSPTDRITFDAATAVGGQSKLLAGPITDDWWRVNFTISGVTPSFLFVVSLGIAA